MEVLNSYHFIFHTFMLSLTLFSRICFKISMSTSWHTTFMFGTIISFSRIRNTSKRKIDHMCSLYSNITFFVPYSLLDHPTLNCLQKPGGVNKFNALLKFDFLFTQLIEISMYYIQEEFIIKVRCPELCFIITWQGQSPLTNIEVNYPIKSMVFSRVQNMK